jgi:hypothetical protein
MLHFLQVMVRRSLSIPFAIFFGHVDVEAMDARDEHVEEYLRDFFESPLFLSDDDDLVALLTSSCSAMRCVGVMRLIDTCLANWKVGLCESTGRCIHSSSMLKVEERDRTFVISISRLFAIKTHILAGLHVTWNSSSPLTARLRPIILPLNVTSTSRPCMIFSAFSKRYCSMSIMPMSKKSKRRAVGRGQTISERCLARNLVTIRRIDSSSQQRLH